MSIEFDVDEHNNLVPENILIEEEGTQESLRDNQQWKKNSRLCIGYDVIHRERGGGGIKFNILLHF